MTFTLAVSPDEIIGLSFVVHGNVGIFVTDFIRDVMNELRKKQKLSDKKFVITIDNARIHK